MFVPITKSSCTFLSPQDGKSSVMTMTATISSVDIPDMDCSPAAIEELIKEVRLPCTSNNLLKHNPSLSRSSMCTKGLC